MDVALGRLVLEEQKLRRDGAGEVVVDDAAHEDHAVAQESGVDVVGALCAPVVGDDRRDEVHMSCLLLMLKPMRARGLGGGLDMAR